jgi:DNA processing protein
MRDSDDQLSIYGVGDEENRDLCNASSLLALMKAPRVGPATAIKIATDLGSWNRLSVASDDELVSVAGKNWQGLRSVTEPVTPILPDGVRIVSFFDDEFPEMLKKIPNPPAVLWVRGSLPQGSCLAIVGTRNPSPSGKQLAFEAAQCAVESGWGIVSGLALGIDTAGHEGALGGGGKTWAYLGCGVDKPTPKKNLALAEQIIAKGGGLIAEVSPGTTTSPQNLVSRNRLQSGSSLGTVVVQSGIPSGTLYTARFALEQERTLVVATPPEKERNYPSWEANLSLTNDVGMPDIGILKGSKRFNTSMQQKGRVADKVFANVDEFKGILGKW